MAEKDSGSVLPAPIRKLVALVGQYPDGIGAAELLCIAQSRFPGAAPARLAALVDSALAAGVLVRDGGTVSVPARSPSAETAGRAVGQPPRKLATLRERGLRVVMIDLESVVRTTDTEPFTDNALKQCVSTARARAAGLRRAPRSRSTQRTGHAHLFTTTVGASAPYAQPLQVLLSRAGLIGAGCPAGVSDSGQPTPWRSQRRDRASGRSALAATRWRSIAVDGGASDAEELSHLKGAVLAAVYQRHQVRRGV